MATGKYKNLVDEKEFDFEYKESLTISKKLLFVNNVSDVVVNGGNYNLLLTDLYFDFTLVRFLTNIDLSDILSSENNIDEIENFINSTDVIDVLYNNITDLIIELKEAVRMNVRYKTGIETNTVSDVIKDLLNKFSKLVDDVDMNEFLRIGKVLVDNTNKTMPEAIVDAYAKSELMNK